MSTTITIRKLLVDMPLGQIFTSQDLLGIGSRAAIDQCLRRLVESGEIRRLARGVFSNGPEEVHVTPLELARIKAGAFHKEVFEHSQTTAQRLRYVPRARKPTTVFATNGNGSSSFQSVVGTIQLKAVSAKKRREVNDEVWDLLKALWYLGKNGISEKIKEQIKKLWGRKSQTRLQAYSSSAPQWLIDLFPRDEDVALRNVYLNIIPYSFEEESDREHNSAEGKKFVANMRAQYPVVEMPEYHAWSQQEWQEWDNQFASQKSECYCPGTHEGCVCPTFNCEYCMSDPGYNRFSLAIA